MADLHLMLYAIAILIGCTALGILCFCPCGNCTLCSPNISNATIVVAAIGNSACANCSATFNGTFILNKYADCFFYYTFPGNPCSGTNQTNYGAYAAIELFIDSGNMHIDILFDHTGSTEVIAFTKALTGVGGGKYNCTMSSTTIPYDAGRSLNGFGDCDLTGPPTCAATTS